MLPSRTLAEWFVAGGYDLRELFRMLTTTRAYQLGSRASDPSPPPELFARMTVKTLTPEQIYDSLSRVALRPLPEQEAMVDPRRQAFLVKMQTQTRSVVDFEVSLPQALALMNGPELSEATDAAASGLLVALEAPFLDDDERVETAFLAALCRPPRDLERSQFLDHVQAKPTAERPKALGDVVWALLNSAEFILNH